MIVNLAPRGHPYGVAVLGSQVFWSDWKKYGLMRADKDTGENAESVGPQIFTRISEIHIHNSTYKYLHHQQRGLQSVGRTCACSDGISLDGETNTTCLVSNTTCPSSVSFGRFLEDCTFEPGRRCTLECDPGYWSESKVYDLLCLADGQWENDMDQFCTVVECPELNITENAYVVSCPVPPIQNSTCVHDCEEGFTWSSGHKELTCEKDGTWSGPQLYCRATIATQPSASVAWTTKPIPTETTTGKAVTGKEGVHKRKGGSVGLIVGILFGVLVLAAIIAVIVVVWRRKSRQSEQ
ncbi:sushi, von Willebrand factor type A, EGF and pentraxin domain-containing protein 1-like [Diadema antillarum]|uniref:sushi, von Willebrand factor type A, EGF and pentraxin domain-containing protein 1-like n=1 Tax=Diadema antillarum TaxID=105358 RepID=UPI003A851A0D